MSAPAVTVIVSTYNRPEVLDQALRGFARQRIAPAEIIVADDGSRAPTRLLLETWKDRLPIRHVWHEDIGFRKTMILNKAVAAATGEYIVFTDGDCVPHRDYVGDHGKLAEAGFWVQARRCFVREPFVEQFTPGATSIVGWVLMGRITGAAKAFRLPFSIVARDQAQRGIIGCNLAAWRSDLVAVNGFDETYVTWGIGEDSDLGTRLYHLGRSRKFVYGRAITCHLDHPLASRADFSKNQSLLEETIRERRIRAVKGLDQYLTA